MACDVSHFPQKKLQTPRNNFGGMRFIQFGMQEVARESGREKTEKIVKTVKNLDMGVEREKESEQWHEGVCHG